MCGNSNDMEQLGDDDDKRLKTCCVLHVFCCFRKKLCWQNIAIKSEWIKYDTKQNSYIQKTIQICLNLV